MSTQASAYAQLKGLHVTFPAPYVLHVELNRPKQLNAMDGDMFDSVRACFEQANEDGEVRAIVLSAKGRLFTSGLDLGWVPFQATEEDPARQSLKYRPLIQRLQQSITSVSKCDKPVIAAIHGACIGGGIDLITACDIRLCSADATFSVKEVDIGICADIGTLQRLPRVVGNGSWVREVCLTARRFPAAEAASVGLVSHVLPDQAALIAKALELAGVITEKSPIATLGTKHTLNHAQDHTVEESLAYQVTWNMAMLNSSDLGASVMASMKKSKPVFAKL